MRLPTDYKNKTLCSPRQTKFPKSFVSPSNVSNPKPKWQKDLILKNKSASIWTQDAPMYSRQGSQRWSYCDASEEIDSLYGSKSSIEYIPDEDDFAKSIYEEAGTTTVCVTSYESSTKATECCSGYNFDELISEWTKVRTETWNSKLETPAVGCLFEYLMSQRVIVATSFDRLLERHREWTTLDLSNLCIYAGVESAIAETSCNAAYIMHGIKALTV